MVLNNLKKSYKQLLKAAQEDVVGFIHIGTLHIVAVTGTLIVLTVLFCGKPDEIKVTNYCSNEYPEVAQELCASTFTVEDVEKIKTGQDKATKERKLKALEILKGDK